MYYVTTSTRICYYTYNLNNTSWCVSTVFVCIYLLFLTAPYGVLSRKHNWRFIVSSCSATFKNNLRKNVGVDRDLVCKKRVSSKHWGCYAWGFIIRVLFSYKFSYVKNVNTMNGYHEKCSRHIVCSVKIYTNSSFSSKISSASIW